MTKKDIEERTKEELEHELSKLRAKMRDGEVVFYYMKKDGSKRKARGTRNKKLIPKEFADKENKRNSDSTFTYFDIDKGDWRCFIKENFLKIAE